VAHLLKTFAGLPTYDGQRWNAGAVADLRQCGADVFESASSLLTNAFNTCYVEALNRRPLVTHFLLLHADVIPLDSGWPLRLVSEMERLGAGVLSVALPIKSETGITSTALENPRDHWRPRRLTTAEIQAKPVSWTAPDLLVNTGLLLIDIRNDWAEKICFTICDELRKVDGKWIAEVEPEDWNFSRQCRKLDVDVWATRLVRALHIGRKSYRNDLVWGEATDPTYQEASV
jgi:hypothetical protein